LQFFLKYDAPEAFRNTLKLEIIDFPLAANQYELVHLNDIDRTFKCQTIATMFANKLIAFINRFEMHKTIATRDLYDINHFLIHGRPYSLEIIRERTKLTEKDYFMKLIDFIEKKVTQIEITQDLNYLLEPSKFQLARKYLKQEALTNLRQEVQRLSV
jgi:hypothetical protein